MEGTLNTNMWTIFTFGMDVVVIENEEDWCASVALLKRGDMK